MTPWRNRGRSAGAAVGIALATLALSAAPARPDTLPGPIEARVTRVLDGDTLSVEAHIWLGQEVAIRVRLLGVDTPELDGACAEERAKADAARELVAAKVLARPVTLWQVRYGKFAGRVLARVRTHEGEDVGELLLAAGLARAYDGGRRASWCGSLSGSPQASKVPSATARRK